MVNKINEIYIKKGHEKDILKHLKEEKEDTKAIEKSVLEIVEDVKKRQDEAIYYYLKKFDKIEGDPPYRLRVEKREIDEAYEKVRKDILSSFEKAIERVEKFHKFQKEKSWIVYDEEGSTYGVLIRPLKRIGIYVPGGRASYPSTLIMGAVPAKIAGVKEIVVVTPPSPFMEVSPYILAVAKLLGIDEIYKMGGAYAIAALAYGTESVNRVDKIVGPGNIYVTFAKKLAWGDVDIDSLAGPSEVVVVGDDTSSPELVALDLIAQAEHDPMARAILISPSEKLIESVRSIIFEYIDVQPRKEIITESIAKRGFIVRTEDIESAVSVSNFIAPEHLQLSVDDPFNLLSLIENAGAVFLGHHASVPLGDYIAGTNHILPTGRRARFSSGLGIHSFYKRIDFFYTKKELSEKLGKEASPMAEVEGFFAHRDRLLGRSRK